jgi:cytochrome P450
LAEHLPFNGARKAYESFENWGQYMDELFAQVEEAHRGDLTEGMGIMGSLVRSSYGKKQDAGKSSPDQIERGELGSILSDSNILGNAFVMIVAGHETTANTIHFGLVQVAANPRSQRPLQKEIESIFGDTPPDTWDYDSNINALLGGMAGTVLNEQLRILPPVVNIPKQVTKHQDQVIIVEGKKFTLPAGAHMSVNVVGTHRNPKYCQPSPRGSRTIDMILTISGQKDGYSRLHRVQLSTLIAPWSPKKKKTLVVLLGRTLLRNCSVQQEAHICHSLMGRDRAWEGDWLKSKLWQS